MILALLLATLCTAIKCPEGEVEVDGVCYPSSCVFDGTVCGGHGTCVDSVCQCDHGCKLGNQGCYPSKCYLVSDDVCNGHGKCVESDQGEYECSCDQGYINDYGACLPEACYTEEGLCFGYGDCIEPTDGSAPYCKCFPANAGEKCTECSSDATFINGECVHKSCFSELIPGETLVCNGMGRCQAIFFPDVHYVCTCYPLDATFYNNTCVYDGCITESNPYGVMEVCSDRGICTNTRCTCDSGYNGPTCEYKVVDCQPGFVSAQETCYPEVCVSDDIICGGYGRCVWNDDGAACACDDGFVFYENTCIYASCIVNGVVCPHGTYDTEWNPPQCICPVDYIIKDSVCYPSTCVTNRQTDPIQLCNSAGTCDFDTGVCNCYLTNAGPTCSECSSDATFIDGVCQPWPCIDERDPNALSVCSGKGTCVSETGSDPFDVFYSCVCDTGYRPIPGGICASAKCVTTSFIICNNRGSCIDGACHCDEGYSGTLCEWYDCPAGQTFVNNMCTPNECVTHYDDAKQTTSVCGNYGRCVKDGDSHKCSCRSDAKVVDGECVSEKCITNSSTNEVCSGHGKCNGYFCICSVGYSGDTCKFATY